ncbi:hypothetical protein OH77DRAFT_1432499 [Trametes cingulata]|nr:hypothetical protein OH77DRAFT_1432499 [Trametes cingulata]
MPVRPSEPPRRRYRHCRQAEDGQGQECGFKQVLRDFQLEVAEDCLYDLRDWLER